MAERITDTFDAAAIAVMRQALGNPPFDAAGPLTTVEAGQRLRRARELAERHRRLTLCALYGAQVVELLPEDRLWARLGAPAEKETEL